MAYSSQHSTAAAAAALPPIVLELQTALRLRPLLKKERDDVVVVEPTLRKNGACLHPLPTPKDLTPSSALVRQTLSSNIETAHDVEYSVDHVLPADSSQDKTYLSCGLPFALSAMEALLKNDHHQNNKKKNHLLLVTGTTAAGKSFSCFGINLGKRKAPHDGLVPRLMDSMFSQSKHHVQRGWYTFGVQLTMVQTVVNTSKDDDDDVMLYDLLQPLVMRKKKKSLKSTSVSAMRSLVIAGLERRASHASSHKSSHGTSKLVNPGAAVYVEQDVVTSDYRCRNLHTKMCRQAEDARDVLGLAMLQGRKLAAKNNKQAEHHVLVQLQPVLLDRVTGHPVRVGGTIAVLDVAAPMGHHATEGVAAAAASTGSSSKPAVHRTVQRDKDLLVTLAKAAPSDGYTAVFNCLKVLQENQQHDTKRTHQPVKGYVEPKKVPFMQHRLTMLLQPLFSPHHASSTRVTVLLCASPGHRDYIAQKRLLHDLHTLWKARGDTPPRHAAVVSMSSSPPVKAVAAAAVPVETATAVAISTRTPRRLSDHSATKKTTPASKTIGVKKKTESNGLTKKDKSIKGRAKASPVTATAHSDADDERSVDRCTSAMSSALAGEMTRAPIMAATASLHPIAAIPSMDYSDSDFDEEYIVPIPPPAPPAIASTFALPPSKSAYATSDSHDEDMGRDFAFAMSGVPIPGAMPSAPFYNGGDGDADRRHMRPLLRKSSTHDSPYIADNENSSTTSDSFGVPVPGGLSSSLGSHKARQTRVAELQIEDDAVLPASSLSSTSARSGRGASFADNTAFDPFFSDDKTASTVPMARVVARPSAPLEDSSSTGAGLPHFMDASWSAAHKFSPLKTFNKVVHVSKKKGKQVMEKMSTSLAPDSTPRGPGRSPSCASTFRDERNENDTLAALQDRIKQLDARNAELEAEVKTLRRENQELMQENEALKADSKSSHGRGFVYHESNAPSPAGSRTSHESSSRTLYDDPLLSHISHMSGLSPGMSRWTK